MSLRATWQLLLIILLAGCGSASAAGSAPSRTAVGLRASPAAVASLVARPIPARNLYTLTEQLKLHPPRPIAHVARRTSPNYPVGHPDNFYVLSEDQNRYFIMHATIRARTPHLYIYVQNGVHVKQSAVQKAAETFEHSTYPTDRSYFGSEWIPGVDGDPHITCLVGNLRSADAAGFYSAEDEYPRLVNPYSNQREMIYINSTALLPGDPAFDQTLAHEFQHMIHWHMHPHDNAWLNEGMSMLAEYLNHYAPSAEPSAFEAQPTTQLDSWSLGADSLAHYGGAYLFLAYLYQRFGRSVIHDIVADRHYTDLALIDNVLQQHHIHETARQVFAQWVVANYLDNRSLAGGIYGYPELAHPVAVARRSTVPFSYEGTVHPYAAQYIVLSVPRHPFQLRFAGAASIPVVGVGQQAPFWWSNRGDMSDTRLERTVDLRRVRSATLHFQAWYDIEKNYDYAYVEASTDGGKTWQTLRGTHTTTANPNGASYGNAYTGDSKGWRNEQVDLSRYAGHRILLRFQYVTDDEYNGQGMVLKDITIPQIGFHDQFTGWQEQGFVPITINSMPSQWTVQLIAYTGKGISVSALPLAAHDHGSVVVDPAKQGLKKLVVVVFTTAPKTTVKAKYHLSATETGSATSGS